MSLDKPISIALSNNEIIEITISPLTHGTLHEISSLEAKEHGEATVQLEEGRIYEYLITQGYQLSEPKVIYPSKLGKSLGQIKPNNYVGTLTIPIINLSDNKQYGELQLEVRSEKIDYRKDYQQMLEEIAEKCTELLMQPNAPISQYFTINFNEDARTLYQRFAFIKGILDTDEFNDAIYKVLLSPVTSWEEVEIEKDIRGIKRIDSKLLRQIINGPNRIPLPSTHPLSNKLGSVPQKVKIDHKRETVDTPENRFVKYALSYFLYFCGNFANKLIGKSKHKDEVLALEEKLNHWLSNALFKEVSSLHTLPLNSPILQRKEGYREIFRTWLMFDLAAKLIWHGGDDVYAGGKKDVATLYEYWVFFKLTDAIADAFKIRAVNINNLIESTADGLGLKLKRGKECIPLLGTFEHAARKFNIRFSYNRTFSGKQDYPNAGSWTSPFRPDYTLSVWPQGITEEKAEQEESMVHIQFDAKYKRELYKIFESNGDLEEEKRQQNQGTYKTADLLKMHAYRDAIRRTAGAYVFYPGDIIEEKRRFHEILPGLGAFAIKPSNSKGDGNALKLFLNNIVEHFLNRASQRERMAFKEYNIHQFPNKNILNELLPEAHGSNRSLIPDEVFILIGYYKSKDHLDWIIKKGLYNTRKGSSPVNSNEAGAKYLLLYNGRTKQANLFFKLKNKGPRIFSAKELIKLNYPSKPTQKFYLVFEIDPILEKEFENRVWDIKKLSSRFPRQRGLPLSVSLTELMEVLTRP